MAQHTSRVWAYWIWKIFSRTNRDRTGWFFCQICERIKSPKTKNIEKYWTKCLFFKTIWNGKWYRKINIYQSGGDRNEGKYSWIYERIELSKTKMKGVIFKTLWNGKLYGKIHQSDENENIRKEIIVNIFIHKQKISKGN